MSAAALPTTAHVRPPEAASHWRQLGHRFARHRLAVFSLGLLAVFYAAALCAEFVAPHDQHERHIDFAYAPPQVPRFSWKHGLHVSALRQHIDPVTFEKSYREIPGVVVPLRFLARGSPVRLWGLVPIQRRLVAPDLAAFAEQLAMLPGPAPDMPAATPTFFLLGADKYGRDLFSRIVHGARVSLTIGLVSVAITFLLGLGIGGLSGYCGGRIDIVLQRVTEVVAAFPQLPLWLALAAVLPAEWTSLHVYFAITVALGALNWTNLARVVRGRLLSAREEDYAVAARLLGAGHARILFRHLLPSVTSHAVVMLTMSVPGMILGETALSFLKLGLRPPIVSWGVLLQDCESLQAVASYPWLLAPVLPIVATVLCFNFVGDGLRDAADPLAT